MNKSSIKFTVFYDEDKWVGIYESKCNNKYSLHKEYYYTKPSDIKLYLHINLNWVNFGFESSGFLNSLVYYKINPKKMKRKVGKETTIQGLGSKAHKALKEIQEQNKLEKKITKRQLKQARLENQFSLKQAKRKQKHKGK